MKEKDVAGGKENVIWGLQMKHIGDPVTCPYCGSILVVRERKYFCGFCEMILGAHQIQHNHERISLRIRDFVLDS